MYNLPNLATLIYSGLFGLACAALIVLGGAGWLAYNLYTALALYLGA